MQGTPVDNSFAHHVVAVASQYKSDFGFRPWMKSMCPNPACGYLISEKDAMTVGVDFSPSMLGDLVISYLCPKCSYAFNLHFKANIQNAEDFLLFFARSAPGCEVEYEHILRKALRHNIVEREQKAKPN